MLDVRTTMRRAAHSNKDRIAVISGDRTLTFGQAWTRGVQLANAIGDLGVKKGDRVAVLEDNRLESADFFIASAVGGFVRVPLYRRNARDSHRHMLTTSGARVVVVDRENFHEVEGLDKEIEQLDHIIIRDDSYEDWLASQSDVDPDPDIALDDMYIIRFSAGTTGLPKGVMYTHRSWVSTMRDWFYMVPPMDPNDRCLHVGPISHGSGYLFLPIWLAGGANILEPKFDPAKNIETIVTHRVTFMFMAPTMIASLTRIPGVDDIDFSFFKAGIVSASPIDAKTAERGRQVFGSTLYQMYGQTEAVPIVHMGPNEWFSPCVGSDPMRAAGRVLPFVELEIRSDDNVALPIGEEGEIAVRSEGQMVGLWNDEEGTTDRLVDGWVLTGDVGKIDVNGYLYVVDRKQDMIISGGFNIWPLELERVLLEDPRIHEAVVFGVPHEQWGETPLACVVVDDLDAITEDEVVSLIQAKLGSYKKPTQVVIQTTAVPKSPVGKIQRKVLREPYWEGRASRVAGS